MVLNPVRLFVLPRFDETKSDIRLLDPQQTAATIARRVLFKKLPDDFSLTSYVRVDEPEESDFLIVPQQIKYRTAAVERYLDSVAATARGAGKRVIVLLTGDLCHQVHIDRPEFIVFKGSDYRSNIHENEIIFAPFVEDLGEQAGVEPRTRGTTPVVSFCGYATFPSWKTRLKYEVMNGVYSVLGRGAYKRGIYFRRKALAALRADSRIKKSFILRDSFTANAGTVKGDPKVLRAEFIQNIVESDFVLTPKGDANFSSRFYETLSLGRIPILIDTDMPFPLPTLINYDEFVVRVPYQEVERVGEYVMDRWNRMSDEEFKEMQRKAREAYEKYLRFDAYWNTALPILRDQSVAALRSRR